VPHISVIISIHSLPPAIQMKLIFMIWSNI
jgi:hypothetical protein